MDALRAGGRHFLNRYSSGGAADQHRPAKFPIDGKGQIKLTLDVRQFFHQQGVDRDALGSRLMGHQILSQQGLGLSLGLRNGSNQFYAASLTPAPGVDLGFKYRSAAQLFGSLSGLLRRGHKDAPGYDVAIPGEDLLCLVFV